MELAIDESAGMGVGRVIALLREAGYRVHRSFDLRSALAATPSACGCPHHGTAACDCQYAVLLVYPGQGTPITLVVHGRDGRSWLLFAEHPGYQPNPALHQALLSVLAPIVMAATGDEPMSGSPNPQSFDQSGQSSKEVM